MEKVDQLKRSAPLIAEKILDFLERVDREAKILDLATGRGYLLRRLSGAGFTNLAAADLDAGSFSLDKGKYNFKELDANEPLPYPGEAFDVVISSETIEHLERPRQFVRECYRILRPGGLFILTTPNVETIFSRLYFLWCGGLAGHTLSDYQQSGHIAVLPSWLMERFAEEAGFKQEAHSYNCAYVPVIKLKLPGRFLNKLLGWIHVYKFKK